MTDERHANPSHRGRALPDGEPHDAHFAREAGVEAGQHVVQVVSDGVTNGVGVVAEALEQLGADREVLKLMPA